MKRVIVRERTRPPAHQLSAPVLTHFSASGMLVYLERPTFALFPRKLTASNQDDAWPPFERGTNADEGARPWLWFRSDSGAGTEMGPRSRPGSGLRSGGQASGRGREQSPPGRSRHLWTPWLLLFLCVVTRDLPDPHAAPEISHLRGRRTRWQAKHVLSFIWRPPVEGGRFQEWPHLRETC